MIGIAKRLLRRMVETSAPAAPHREVLEGYENPELIEITFRKTLAFRSFRDELSGAKTVLDFGGACGVHYKMACDPAIRWAVVETPAMARRAAELSTESLQFFTGIDAAVSWLGSVDVMHSNGAIQYTPDPEATVRALCAVRARIMLWKRLTLSTASVESRMQVTRLVDNGPGIIPGTTDVKDVAYRETSIPEAIFLACHQGYRLTEREGGNFRFERD